MTHSPDRHPQGQDAQQLGAKHESGNSSENRGSMTTTSISVKAALLDLPFANTAPIEWSDEEWSRIVEALTRIIPTAAPDDAAVERGRLCDEALQNVIGFLDNAVMRRRFVNDDFYRPVIESIRAALTASIPPTTAPECWRDIASAPKDESWFVALQDGETYPCQWYTDEPDEGPPTSGWFDLFNQSFEAPTHWAPTLAALTTTAQGEVVPAELSDDAAMAILLDATDEKDVGYGQDIRRTLRAIKAAHRLAFSHPSCEVAQKVAALIERLEALANRQRKERGDYLYMGQPDPEIVDAIAFLSTPETVSLKGDRV